MINKLVEKIKKTKAPIVVGLDPMVIFLSMFRKKRLQSMGKLWKGLQRQSGSLIKKS